MELGISLDDEIKLTFYVLMLLFSFLLSALQGSLRRPVVRRWPCRQLVWVVVEKRFRLAGASEPILSVREEKVALCLLSSDSHFSSFYRYRENVLCQRRNESGLA